MRLERAKPIADRLIRELEPHCERISIAGSIRRECKEVGDIEIVCIPRKVAGGLFGDEMEVCGGFVDALSRYRVLKGNALGKYTRRKIEDGVELDLFMAAPENWGMILAIRTGSAEYVRDKLAAKWSRMGYRGDGGVLTRDGERYFFPKEEDVFKFLGLPWAEPKNRKVVGV